MWLFQAAYLNGHDHTQVMAVDMTAPALNPTM